MIPVALVGGPWPLAGQTVECDRIEGAFLDLLTKRHATGFIGGVDMKGEHYSRVFLDAHRYEFRWTPRGYYAEFVETRR